MEAWELALALAGSFVAGYVGSMLGLVLGTLRLPLLVALAGSPLAAAGTNIAISAASAGAGAIRHARERRVDWRVVAGWRRRRLRGRSSARSWPTTSRSSCSTQGSPQSSSGAGSTLRSGRCSHAHGSACGSGRRSRPASASARSAAPSASSSARCGCPRSFAASEWTSSAPRARISSSASCSASRASRAHAGALGVDWPLLLAGLAGAIPGGWLGAKATGRIDEDVLRLALGAMLVVVGVAFAVQAAV